MPLSPGNFGEEGERDNGKDRGKGQKKGSKEKETKRIIWCRQDPAEYAGAKDSAERVPTVGHDCMWMF